LLYACPKFDIRCAEGSSLRVANFRNRVLLPSRWEKIQSITLRINFDADDFNAPNEKKEEYYVASLPGTILGGRTVYLQGPAEVKEAVESLILIKCLKHLRVIVEDPYMLANVKYLRPLEQLQPKNTFVIELPDRGIQIDPEDAQRVLPYQFYYQPPPSRRRVSIFGQLFTRDLRP
jgi:hypothetical protein